MIPDAPDSPNPEEIEPVELPRGFMALLDQRCTEWLRKNNVKSPEAVYFMTGEEKRAAKNRPPENDTECEKPIPTT